MTSFCKYKVHIRGGSSWWRRQICLFAYLLYNFYGAPTTIKGRYLMKIL